jgi:hypothetical protein
LYCRQCQSTDLRKVSLVYQQGRFEGNARTQLRGLLLGVDGPDLIVGYAHTAGVLQTQLSEKLRPPVKWSYLKLVGWLVFFSLLALIAYVQSVMGSSGTASSLPVAIYVVVAGCLFVVLGFCIWRHNHRVYPVKYARWERSFLCMRCGSISGEPCEGAVSCLCRGIASRDK